MKKFLKILILFTLIISLNHPANIVKAADVIDSTATIINDNLVKEMLNESGYGGNNFETYILRNNENVPSYTLGVSENGYIIVENTTLATHEYGEGNPYENANGFLYYAGPLNYYCIENNTMINLMTLETASEMPLSLSITPIKNNGDVSTMSVVESGVTKVSNYKNYLQRRAFGKNTNNVCGAVAVQIVLNYLELQSGNDFVHSSHNSELLKTTSYSASTYPKAAAMLTHLVSTCGIGTNVATYALVGGVSNYVNITNIADKSLSATWTINPSTATIKNKIAGNIPVILLTQGHPTYGNHYLVAYGYKTNSQGNVEWLVHTGWYSNVITADGVQRHSNIFINDNYVDYAVYFNY